MAHFGPDALAQRCLFVGVKRTSLRTAPKSENDPERTLRLLGLGQKSKY